MNENFRIFLAHTNFRIRREVALLLCAMSHSHVLLGWHCGARGAPAPTVFTLHPLPAIPIHIHILYKGVKNKVCGWWAKLVIHNRHMPGICQEYLHDHSTTSSSMSHSHVLLGWYCGARGAPAPTMFILHPLPAIPIHIQILCKGVKKEGCGWWAKLVIHNRHMPGICQA